MVDPKTVTHTMEIVTDGRPYIVSVDVAEKTNAFGVKTQKVTGVSVMDNLGGTPSPRDVKSLLPYIMEQMKDADTVKIRTNNALDPKLAVQAANRLQDETLKALEPKSKGEKVKL